jgi:hypothetical protein
MNELTDEEKYQIMINTCEKLYPNPCEVLIFITTFLTSMCAQNNYTTNEARNLMNLITQTVLDTFKQIKEKKDV